LTETVPTPDVGATTRKCPEYTTSGAEFGRDLICERIKSGIAAAKAHGKQLGRQPGQQPSDRKGAKVFALAKAGVRY
jgi:DNA invertase Pin-like site-specific DNA recombinase